MGTTWEFKQKTFSFGHFENDALWDVEIGRLLWSGLFSFIFLKWNAIQFLTKP